MTAIAPLHQIAQHGALSLFEAVAMLEELLTARQSLVIAIQDAVDAIAHGAAGTPSVRAVLLRAELAALTARHEAVLERVAALLPPD
jgi:hypothetical protein